MTTKRTLPSLPREINSVPVAEWTRWKRAVVMSHIDPGCPTCGDSGPSCIALGYEHYRGNESGLMYRWNAHRCPACDEITIYERRTDPDTLRRYSAEVAYYPPRREEDR
ncbi:hypothetical protein FHX37_0469 [Haloactinospora alba]|uniref:Uncharacterized protein n=1 Tax=Haloactinospora alba TaxID=405555 RepID=A0A543NFJ5_9ACTN|nr:hypothetical protein [Haloactinospora alba]TQN30587.1 hypothetical protein FHX37_0469 [Haloactinospora alba]